MVPIGSKISTVNQNGRLPDGRRVCVQEDFLCIWPWYICIPNVVHLGACRLWGFKHEILQGVLWSHLITEKARTLSDINVGDSYDVPWPRPQPVMLNHVHRMWRVCRVLWVLGMFWLPNMRFFRQTNILNLQKQQGPRTEVAGYHVCDGVFACVAWVNSWYSLSVCFFICCIKCSSSVTPWNCTTT